MRRILILSFLYLIYVKIENVESFVPAKLMTEVIGRMESKFDGNLGKTSETIVHDEIMRRGLIQSIVRYFYDQPNGKQRVDLNKINNQYYDLKRLYFDYYGYWICDLRIEDYIKLYFQPNVALIDFDPATKDMPYAHFDAEKFNESNQRVIEYTARIYDKLNSNDFGLARVLAGQILHTIQDFYSHSNWVEMGRLYLNTDIGTSNFSSSQSTVNPNDPNLCVSNCTMVSEECNLFVSIIAKLIGAIGLKSKFITCPLVYYKCTNNIIQLEKLVSGYYVEQKLPDGTPVDKPDGLDKCSHGGILDGSSSKIAKGGMNKDSGYYLFSPHADLHLKAASLAVNHTEYFFNQIRAKIGDDQFDNFLKLKISAVDQAFYNKTNVTCSSNLIQFHLDKANLFLFSVLTHLVIFIV